MESKEGMNNWKKQFDEDWKPMLLSEDLKGKQLGESIKAFISEVEADAYEMGKEDGAEEYKDFHQKL